MTVWHLERTHRPYATARTARFVARVMQQLLDGEWASFVVNSLEVPPWSIAAGPARVGGVPCFGRIPPHLGRGGADWAGVRRLGTRREAT